MWKCKGPRRAKTTLKKNKAGEVTLTDFKTSYKATVNTTVWCWCQDRKPDLQNTTESWNMPRYIWTTDFDKGAKVI